jgi:hypothetical protein
MTITKINGLMQSKEIIAVYSENRMRPINTHGRQNAVNEDGTESYHHALKSQSKDLSTTGTEHMAELLL